MLYLAIKALHIVAAIVWVGSLFLLTFITSSNGSGLNASQVSTAGRVSEAGIGLTWLAGLSLAVLGGWYASAWWQIKLVLVILISAIHTIMYRRWEQQSKASVDVHTNNIVPWILLGLTLLVVLLVVFKRP